MPEGGFIGVKVAGSALSATQSSWFVEVEVSEALDRLDLIEVEFAMFDYANAMDDVERILNMHGKELTAEIRDPDLGAVREVTGEVIEIQSVKDGSNLRTRLRAIDKLHRLKRTQVSDELKGSVDKVVKSILSEVGSVEGGKVEGVQGSQVEFLAANLSAARLIKALGQTYAYAVGYPAGQFYFGRAGSGASSSAVTVDFDGIAQLRIQHSLDGIVKEVEVIGYDAEKDEWITGKANDSKLKKIAKGKLGIELAKKVGAGKLTIDNAHIQGTQQANAIAAGELQTRARRFCQGTLLFTGGLLENAIPGGFLEITNGPPTLSDKFLITEITNRYRGGEALESEVRFISDGLPAGV